MHVITAEFKIRKVSKYVRSTWTLWPFSGYSYSYGEKKLYNQMFWPLITRNILSRINLISSSFPKFLFRLHATSHFIAW